jgi:hypothetical protein
MSSIPVRKTPVISFVGRPLDSKKGLTTFLDALHILASLDRIPPHHTWIIGGLEAEREFVERLVAARPRLAAAQRSGAVCVWGRVETDSLPEFYARSTVVVMPSSREQYGLVAIEAMMCGCPVVGSSVGGLQDLIVPGDNGWRVPVDDAGVLANVLSAYLRDPGLGERQGRTAAAWAGGTLRQQELYQRYEAVYAGDPGCTDPLRDGWARMRRLRLDAIAAAAERYLGAVARWEEVPAGRHVCARITLTDGRTYFAKHAAEPDWPEGAVLPLPPSLSPPWTPAESASLYAALPEGAPVPVLAAMDVEAGIVFTDWHEAFGPGTEAEVEGAVAEVAGRFRTCAVPADGAEWASSLEAVARNRDPASVRRFDDVAAVLSARGGAIRFRPAHPQVELLRLGRLLRRRCWSLPDAFSARAAGVAAMLLQERPIAVMPPAFRHGDLHRGRLLRGPDGLLACDPGTARFAWGPLDESRHVHRLVRERESLSATTALRHLDAMVEGEEERHLGACWLAVHLIYDALRDLTRGSTVGVHRGMRFFHGIYEALYGRRISR